MNKYKKGTQFTVCSEDELKKKGWVFKGNYYYHDDFPSDRGGVGPPISKPMIGYGGKTFTIKEPYKSCKNWYYVNENTWIWPVATFLDETITISVVVSNHECSEGITPIFGWMICKHCGENLREIK